MITDEWSLVSYQIYFVFMDELMYEFKVGSLNSWVFKYYSLLTFEVKREARSQQ